LSNFIKQDGSPYLRLRVPLEILKNAMGPLGDFPYDIGNVPAFQDPTLFLRALQSNFIPQSSFPLISKFFPKSKIVDMECGHWIVQDKPQQFKEGMFMLPEPFGKACLHANYLIRGCEILAEMLSQIVPIIGLPMTRLPKIFYTICPLYCELVFSATCPGAN
jgi:hypothetical protein